MADRYWEASVMASKTWRGVRMTPRIEKELRKLEAEVFKNVRSEGKPVGKAA